ncbi:MAG: DUF134 domain-containing protein [Candidatus Altiarchaeales archaeon]|nr:DUF134 domain-containing protein [Candidatus Altiarchaeales archaeon]
MDSESRKGRPKCLRKVSEIPEVNYFKPRGIPLTELEQAELKVEELEALKLVYLEGMKRERAAESMGVSRRTMQRELNSGLKKIVDALLSGKAIEIKGGYFVSDGEVVFRCLDDKYQWKQDKSLKKPEACPECGSKKIKKER